MTQIKKLFCFLLLTACFASPALADDAASAASRMIAVPKAVAGVIYGVGIGVPLRAGKYMYSESDRMTKTLLDDFGGPGFWNMAMARSIGIPYGVASGAILGLIKGVQYGSEYGMKEPFSKISIGLGESTAISRP